MEETEHLAKMKDVYVTDHVRKTPKFLTHSAEEDAQLVNYWEAVNRFNADNLAPRSRAPKPKFRRGSFLQKVMDPLAGAVRNADGTYQVTLTEEDLNKDIHNEEKLRQLYDHYVKVNSEPTELNCKLDEGVAEDATHLEL